MKTVNDLLNDLVEAKALTEEGKLIILLAAEKEKYDAVLTYINQIT